MQLQGRAAAAAQAAAKTAAAKAAGTELSAAAEAAAKKALANRRGFIKTGIYIFSREGVKGLYRGLGAVIAGITPKMAIRFWSFEELKRLLTPKGHTGPTTWGVFASGIGAGIIEAVAVVNPTDVVKIRLQAQSHSLIDPTDGPKYRNALHCLYTVIREEGISAIYRGVALTAARQATNQGTNFTVYTLLKQKLQEWQPQYEGLLPGWQTSLIGLTSGALGPMSNAPLDVIKTRMQRERVSGESSFRQMTRITKDLLTHEGPTAFYRGVTPRIMRVAPGQAVTFTVYEWARAALEKVPGLAPKPKMAAN